MALEVAKLREIAKNSQKNPISTDISAVLLVKKPQEIYQTIRDVKEISLRSFTTHFSMRRQKNALKLRKYGEKHAKISPNLRKLPSKQKSNPSFLLLS